MNDPISSPSCPDCGAPLPADSPQALCPACLMRQALASRTVVRGERKNAAPPPPPEEIADRFPQFEILECLGRGGMGVVYKARQKSLNRIVAIKILAPEREHESGFAGRFAREAELLARLNHPHIVTIHDFGETGGLFYLVMEYVDGVNLRDLLRDGKLEPKQALAIVPPICEALQYAHDKGIVHRDIKPENLLLDREGRIKIADFGIAALIGTGGDHIGTPPYMAPEQSGDAPEVDCRADIYALGVVLYEMLTGERPNKDLVAPSKKVHIDVRLDEMVLRALEKEPERRYQTAGEFRTVVETMKEAPLPETRPSAVLQKIERGRMAIQETPGSPVPYPAMGELALHSDRLVISSGYSKREVLLGEIRALGETVPPWWFSPAGHCFAAVDFDENGTRCRLVFMAGESPFRFVGSTRLQASEWLTAIQQAVKAATGNEMAISPSSSVFPIKSNWSLIWLLPVVVVMMIALKILMDTSLANGPSLRAVLVLLPFLVPLAIPLVILLIRNRSISKQTGAASFESKGRNRGWGWMMMITIGASFGIVAGGIALLMKRKHAATPTQTGTAVFRPVIEITLPDPAIGSFCVLDFEIGILLEPPGEIVPLLNNEVSKLPPAALRWLRDHGADAVLAPDGSVRLIEGVVFHPTREGKALMWDDFTPDTVVDIVAGMSEAQRQDSAGQPAFRFVTARQPAAVAFTTRERSCGVLQILGASDHPHGVKIRYMLVQSATPFPPLPPGYQRGQIPPRPPAYEKINESETPETTSPTAAHSFEDIKAINDTNQFLDLELVVIDAKANGMGDQHPSVTVAADVLARFKETHPNVPATIWQQLVGERLAKAKAQLATLSAGGLGELHPAVVKEQARIRALAEMMEQRATVEAGTPQNLKQSTPIDQAARIAVEDLALQMIVAIREKNDARLKSLACDQIKGWRDALPVFAVEMREHYRQGVGDEKFDLRAVESLVDGDLAAVKCTGPEKLKDVCLILFFAKTDEGWRNHSLKNAPLNAPLAQHLADLKTKLRK